MSRRRRIVYLVLGAGAGFIVLAVALAIVQSPLLRLALPRLIANRAPGSVLELRGAPHIDLAALAGAHLRIDLGPGSFTYPDFGRIAFTGAEADMRRGDHGVEATAQVHSRAGTITMSLHSGGGRNALDATLRTLAGGLRLSGSLPQGSAADEIEARVDSTGIGGSVVSLLDGAPDWVRFVASLRDIDARIIWRGAAFELVLNNVATPAFVLRGRAAVTPGQNGALALHGDLHLTLSGDAPSAAALSPAATPQAGSAAATLAALPGLTATLWGPATDGSRVRDFATALRALSGAVTIGIERPGASPISGALTAGQGSLAWACQAGVVCPVGAAQISATDAGVHAELSLPDGGAAARLVADLPARPATATSPLSLALTTPASSHAAALRIWQENGLAVAIHLQMGGSGILTRLMGADPGAILPSLGLQAATPVQFDARGVLASVWRFTDVNVHAGAAQCTGAATIGGAAPGQDPVQVSGDCTLPSILVDAQPPDSLNGVLPVSGTLRVHTNAVTLGSVPLALTNGFALTKTGPALIAHAAALHVGGFPLPVEAIALNLDLAANAAQGSFTVAGTPFTLHASAAASRDTPAGIVLEATGAALRLVTLDADRFNLDVTAGPEWLGNMANRLNLPAALGPQSLHLSLIPQAGASMKLAASFQARGAEFRMDGDASGGRAPRFHGTLHLATDGPTAWQALGRALAWGPIAVPAGLRAKLDSTVDANGAGMSMTALHMALDDLTASGTMAIVFGTSPRTSASLDVRSPSLAALTFGLPVRLPLADLSLPMEGHFDMVRDAAGLGWRNVALRVADLRLDTSGRMDAHGLHGAMTLAAPDAATLQRLSGFTLPPGLRQSALSAGGEFNGDAQIIRFADLHVGALGITARYSGTVQLNNGPAASGNIGLEAARTSSLAGLFGSGTSLPPNLAASPVHLAARIGVGRTGVTLAGLHAQAGGISLSASQPLVIGLAGPRDGAVELTMPDLRLPVLGDLRGPLLAVSWRMPLGEPPHVRAVMAPVRLWGGSVSGDVTATLAPGWRAANLDQATVTIAGIDFATVCRGGAFRQFTSGQADASASFSGAVTMQGDGGLSTAELLRNLNGTGLITLRHAKWPMMNLDAEVDEDDDDKLQVKPSELAAGTDIVAAELPLALHGSHLRFSGASMHSRLVRVSADGDIDLAALQMQVDLRPQVALLSMVDSDRDILRVGAGTIEVAGPIASPELRKFSLIGPHGISFIGKLADLASGVDAAMARAHRASDEAFSDAVDGLMGRAKPPTKVAAASLAAPLRCGA
jgi:hypothetical protein